MSIKEYDSHADESRNQAVSEQERFEIDSPVNTATPLHFALRINGSYYVSFKKGDFWIIMLRTAVWLLLNLLINYVVHNILSISDWLKDVVFYVLVSQIVLHLVICLLDAGTIFEDEEDEYGEDRVYCLTCKLYRRRTSKHCIWCNRCTKRYDHHCSVFGKCIGKRNLVPFWLFIMLCGFEFPGLIVIMVTHLVRLE